MANTPRPKDVFEVFEAVAAAKTRKAKVKILQDNNRMPVRDVLQGTFDPRVQWNLPEGTPPYTPQADGPPPPNTLLKEHMKFKYFVKGNRTSDDLDSIRRERMFIDILESVHCKDAAIMVSMINKQKPEYEGLTEKLVKEAFPDLIPT
jgi:hypothetical protein